MRVNDDKAAVVGVHPGGVQPEVAGVRVPTGRDEQPIAGHLVAACRPHRHRAVGGPRHPDGAFLDDRDAVVGEDRAEHVGDLRLGVRREPAHERHPDPEVRPQLGLL